MKHQQLSHSQNKEDKQSLIVFDGVCMLCNSSIQFLIQHDKHRRFRYTTVQSYFKNRKQESNKNADLNLSSVILISKNKQYNKSTAILHILKQLGGMWSLLFIFMIIPRTIRDYIYQLVARNRYRWFGKCTQCMIPSEEQKDLFI